MSQANTRSTTRPTTRPTARRISRSAPGLRVVTEPQAEERAPDARRPKLGEDPGRVPVTRVPETPSPARMSRRHQRPERTRRSEPWWWRRVRDAVLEDIDAAVERDPAATSRAQMAIVSPGLHALWGHRVAHLMWQHERLRLPARVLSNVVRTATGTEIHPGATIGRRFFIDHAMSVVIGETTLIGDDVMLYQGVTLGGRTLAQGKRHPTLGNNVTVGAGARILGNITVGDHAQIGANAVVVKDVPNNHVATGVPAKHRALQASQDPYEAMYTDPALWI